MHSEKNMWWGKVSPQGYEFTENASGQVTGEQFVFGSYTYDVYVPGGASFSTGAGTVTETFSFNGLTETLQYAAEPSNANLYQVAQETVTVANPTTSYGGGYTVGYQFTVNNGTVSAPQVVLGPSGQTQSYALSSSPATVFSAGGNTVTETTVRGNDVETIQYVQPAGSTLYAIASRNDSFIAQGSSATPLSINPWVRGEFTIGAGGAVTSILSVSPTGATSTFTPSGGEAFTQIAAGFVEETMTYGSYTAFALFHEAGNGIYTEVAHGSGTTVDLVGVQNQLAQLAHLAPALAGLV